MFNVIDLILVVMPFLIYFIYCIINNVTGNKENDLFLELSIITSLYLITKYSSNLDIVKVLFLVSLLKKKYSISMTLFIYMIIILPLYSNYNFYLYLIESILQIIVILCINVSIKNKLLLYYLIDLISLIYLQINYIYINLIYVLISYIIYYLINRGEVLVGLYGTIKKVEYDKNLRDSVFKVAHEIKNPIAVCKGYLDMLDMDNINQVNKYIPIVKSEIDRTLTIMSDFLSLNKLSINPESMDMSILLDDLCLEVNELIIGKRIKFNYDIPNDETFIIGDYDRLKQVFINVIKNSIESIDNSGIIELDTKVNKNNINITIKDSGVGMSKDELKRIGESFYTTKKYGTGLGVKMCKEIIELHNGKIKYSSIKNVGTTVKIVLKKASI